MLVGFQFVGFRDLAEGARADVLDVVVYFLVGYPSPHCVEDVPTCNSYEFVVLIYSVLGVDVQVDLSVRYVFHWLNFYYYLNHYQTHSIVNVIGIYGWMCVYLDVWIYGYV